ncbi:hypothetical protein HG530_004211 [Fusarium avenaceum]|nr:hypothetical protein HG530_004211 [Fusarium avenaceum]
MDSKRKANGAASVDTDDRGSKRRRLTGDFDLSKGETRESTTAYGVSFLEQVRRTADKSGRLIASNFEELPSREEDADYYKKTRMPISISTIEKKLNNGEFKNLSEVEGYFKRMISNAKEYFARSTEQYDDAERIRKALSNFMTKTNPAYHGAQEKIMEELIRREDPGYEGSYFEAFINLPPRSLKEYFKVISEPISIRKLQKMVKGMHARGETTGSSDFKSWAAFEEKAKLLWTNAYFFNEEGSEIYSVAQELECQQEFFYDQLKQAQAAVAEPSQPKIKLKVGGSNDTPTPGPKKITIHVGGQRDSADSPAPAQQKETITNGLNVNGTARTSTPAQVTNPQLEKVTSASVSALPSPTPSTQAAPSTEEAAKATPAPLIRTLSGVATQGTPGIPIAAPIAPPAPVPVAPPQPIHNPLINGYMEQKHPRRAGKGIDDALIETMKIQVHPSLQSHSPVLATIKPNPLEMDQAATLNLPSHLTRILVVTAIPSHLQNRQYSLWTLVNRQPLKPILHQASGQKPHERAFEAMLHPGVNLLESHLIAAIPRDERVPGGPEVELETFTISVNVLRN